MSSRWSGVSQAYRQSFATLCAGTAPDVLDHLQPVTSQPGQLLDAGCGTGDLAREAIRRGFAVTCFDADADMVAMTRAATGLDAAQAELPQLPYADGSFDSVAANFVINHTDNPRAAVRELVRVLRAGGRLSMTIWPSGGAGWSSLVSEVFSAANATPLPSTRLPEHLDFERTPDGLAAISREAGVDINNAGEISWNWDVRPDDLWAGIAGGVATPGQTYLAQTSGVQAAVKREFFNRTGTLTDSDGLLHFPCRAVLVVSQRF